MKKIRVTKKILFLIFCLFQFSVCEDVIYLKNGRKLRGNIIKITKTALVIDLGFGETDVGNDEIEKVVKDGISVAGDWEKTGSENEEAAVEAIPGAEPRIEETSDLAPVPIPVQKDVLDVVPKIEPEKKPENDKKRSLYNIQQSTTLQSVSTRNGSVVKGTAALNNSLLNTLTIPKDYLSILPKSVEIALYYPKNYSEGKQYPLFVVMGPGKEIGLAEINTYAPFADELGFIAAVFQIPPEADFEESRFYYTLHIIEYLKELYAIDNKPIWVGGVSGGGQWALQLGMYGGDIFSGILAVGRIEDLAFIADSEIKNKTIFDVPICLLNTGLSAYAGSIASIRKAGFTQLKVLVYTGEKSIPHKEIADGFKWLMRNAK